MKRALLLGIVAAAGLVLLSTTRQWWTILVDTTRVDVQGSIASPALSALALSSLALSAALAIAGVVFRVVLGVLQMAIGATTVLAAWSTLREPVIASATPVSEATGLTGEETLRAAVTGIDMTAWGWIAIVGGIVAFGLGLAVLFSARRWPTAPRKYDAVRLSQPNGDPVSDWDALSEGNDPTAATGSTEPPR